MLVVNLPQNFQMNAVSKFTSQIVGFSGEPLDDVVVFDFEKLNFIDGNGYTVLSNSIGWLASKGVEVRFRRFNHPNNHAVQYLDDCGFFLKYAKCQVRSSAKVRDTTVPCIHIQQQQSFSWVERRLSPWLEWTLGVGYGQVASIRTCVKEVLNNIADHSKVSTGFVHAQHYPNTKNIKIITSDFGEGIPNTIRNRYGPMSDFEAILHATKNGVTAQSQPNNMGAGLSYLVDTVLANGGVVRLHSLTGNLTCRCDNRGRMQQHRGRGSGLYPGTLIEIELDTRLFVGDDDDRADFEW
ncbi:hypothetical protein WBP07_10145 [Novosphingobium sp. BL-8A]|uniref:hypothetical protein n=1 Tax=Novosphingobium sp. BL-8A TaxID=3127639 RepID=UPI003757DF11